MKLLAVTGGFLIGVILTAHAQKQPSLINSKPVFATKKTIKSESGLGYNSLFNNPNNQFGKIIAGKSDLIFIPPHFTLSNWGWFCRQEYKFEQATKIPFAFRLGSKAMVDELEGKFKNAAKQEKATTPIFYR